MPNALGIGSRFLAGLAGGGLPGVLASGPTNLEQTNGLVWIMIGIATAGTIVTFAFLVYSLWKFRDPNVKDRPYG